MPELEIRKFRLKDFPEFRAWFADDELNRRLGPMEENDAWLDVLNDENAIEYSVFRGEELVAVIGMILPTDEHPDYTITELAVKPALRGHGIGSAALAKVFEQHPLKAGQSWRAFVDKENPRAKAFLEKNGWRCESEAPDEHGMLNLIYQVS